MRSQKKSSYDNFSSNNWGNGRSSRRGRGCNSSYSSSVNDLSKKPATWTTTAPSNTPSQQQTWSTTTTSNESVMNDILKCEEQIETIRSGMRKYDSFKQYETEAVKRDQDSEFDIFCLEIEVIRLRDKITPTALSSSGPSSRADNDNNNMGKDTTSSESTATVAHSSLAPNSWGIAIPKKVSHPNEKRQTPPPPPPPPPLLSSAKDRSPPAGKWVNELYCWFPHCDGSCGLCHCSPEQRHQELKHHAKSGKPVQFCGRHLKGNCFSSTCSYYHGSAVEEQHMIRQLAESPTPQDLPRRLLCRGYLFSKCPARGGHPCHLVHPRHIDALLESFGNKDLATIEKEFNSAPALCLKRR